MVEIRGVLVGVGEPRVLVRVRVLAGERRIVRVIVVAVVVPVHVIVLERLVDVRVVVALGEVQVDTGHEQRRRGQGWRSDTR